MSKETMIEVDHLTKYYGDFPAISEISFTVNKGEVLGFLGPNAAGKTTTMRILTGFMPPTSGTVRIAGYDVVAESREARKHIGYLPETVPLYTDMTVKGYLALARAGMAKTGYRGIYQPGIQLTDFLTAKTEPVHYSRGEIFD